MQPRSVLVVGMKQPLRLVRCPKCGGRMREGSRAHSPHWVVRIGRNVIVDCVGDVVDPWPPPQDGDTGDWW